MLRTFIPFLFGCGLLTGTLAQAPEPASEAAPATELPPITVIATRTERSAMETAESVTQIDASAIELRQASNLAEAVAHSPGVHIEGGPRASGSFINIRGLSGPRVLLAVDGARQNFSAGHRSSLLIDPALLKSIDILRGPASAVWGSDALAGVVSVTTKDAADLLTPERRLGARISTGYEQAARERNAGLAAYGRIGALDLLASGQFRHSDDYRLADDSRLPNSALRNDAGLYKLSWLPGTAHRLGLSAQTFGQRGRSPSNPANPVDDENPLLDRDAEQRFVNLHYGYQGDGRLQTARFSLYDNQSRYVEDRVDTPRHDETRFNTRGGAGQLSLALPGADQRLSIGTEIYQDTARAQRDGAARPQYPDAQRRIAGLFVQDELRFGPVSLIPGLRVDRYHAEADAAVAEAVDEQAVSRKLGLVYRLRPWLSLRASYGEAFRAPSLEEIYPSGFHFLGNRFVPNPQLRPERAANKEIGFVIRKQAWLHQDDHLAFSAAAYRNDVEDFIETVVTVDTQVPAFQCLAPMPPTGCINRNDDGSLNPLAPPIFIGGSTTSANLPQARLQGFETALRYGLGTWHGAIDYAQVRGTSTQTGQALLNIPADTLHAEIGWQFLHSAGLVLAATHAGAQNRVPVGDDDSPLVPATPSYTVLDLSLRWRPALGLGEGLELIAGVDNLGNRAYRQHLNAEPSPGRSLRAAVHYSF